MKQFYKFLMAFIACHVFFTSFAIVNERGSKVSLKDLPSVIKNLNKSRISSPNKIMEPIGPMITEKPSGESTLWCVDAVCYELNWNGIGIEEYENSPSEFIEPGNGEIYISNLGVNALASGWAKGTIENDLITIPLPQIVEEMDFLDVTYVYELVCLRYIDGMPLDFDAFEIAEDITSITMSKTETGWHLDLPDNGSIILGLYSPTEEIWVGYANIIANWSPAPWDLVKLPEGVTTLDYGMISDSQGYIVKGTTDKNDIYLQGISPTFPESVIKGKIDGDKAIFESNQLLGINDDSFVFFQGGAYGEVYDEYFGEYYYNYYPIENLIFDYDKETGALIVSEEKAILINTLLDGTRCLQIFWMPELLQQPANIDIELKKPKFVSIEEIDYWGEGYFTFSLDNFNDEGYVINPHNLYFLVTIDGIPVQFENNLGFENTENLIPFNYNDYYLVTKNGNKRTMIYYEGQKKATVTLIYITPDGEKIESETLEILLDDTGIEHLSKESIAKYYDLFGRRINNPDKGIYIEVKDGKSRKVLF